jgi:hypothetical protein
MNLNINILLLFFALFCSFSWSQEKAKSFQPQKSDSAAVKFKTSKEILLDELNINGDRINNIFILGTQLDLGDGDRAVQTSIENKSLAKDDFYMQNIDREEFETEKILKDLKDSDHNYGTSISILKKYIDESGNKPK